MINLLPPQIKKEQKIGQLSRQINVAAISLIIMLSLTYAAVYMIDYYLANQIEKNSQQLDSNLVEIAKLKPIEDDIISTNSKLGKLDQLKKDRFNWSTILSDFNSSTPAQVSIKSLQLDKKTNKVVLSAVAQTRSDIVKFQAKLSELAYLKNISFGNSTFSESDNSYSFTLNGTISK